MSILTNTPRIFDHLVDSREPKTRLDDVISHIDSISEIIIEHIEMKYGYEHIMTFLRETRVLHEDLLPYIRIVYDSCYYLLANSVKAEEKRRNVDSEEESDNKELDDPNDRISLPSMRIETQGDMSLENRILCPLTRFLLNHEEYKLCPISSVPPVIFNSPSYFLEEREIKLSKGTMKVNISHCNTNSFITRSKIINDSNLSNQIMWIPWIRREFYSPVGNYLHSMIDFKTKKDDISTDKGLYTYRGPLYLQRLHIECIVQFCV